MDIKVKTHPLAEIIQKKLFGFESVPHKEQRKMINRAIKAACKYHDEAIKNANKGVLK